ncbi:MAG TPA: type IV secretion system DNA-binding domain-containing protein [Anaerolineae bacterium]|nr:type IV secretion system DNA-binding domain-containing protein [Anaerolineae bacterium]
MREAVSPSQVDSQVTRVRNEVQPEPVVLGHEVTTEEPVCLSYAARRYGTYIIGMAGSGKTTTLLTMAMQDIASDHGLCVIDPQGKWIEDILARIPAQREEDVIYLNPAEKAFPVGLHLFECADPDDDDVVDVVMSQVVKGVFEEIWGPMEQMPRMADVLRTACRTLIRCQSIPDERLRPTLVEMPRLLRDEDYRGFLLEHIHSRYALSEVDLLRWWDDYEAKGAYRQDEQIASTLNKVQEFAQSAMVKRVVGQNKSTVDFRRAMDEGKIVLVSVSEGEVGREVASLIGALVISRIHIAARSRVELIKRGVPLRRFHLLVDEFQNFATKAFAKLQDECRQYAVDITIAHQNRMGQLAEERQVQASTLNMTNWIVFRTNPNDAEVLATGFKTTPPEPEVRGEHEPLGLASYPWDELKRRAHDNQEVTALVHEFDSWLAVRQAWDLLSWPRLKKALNLVERNAALDSWIAAPHQPMDYLSCPRLKGELNLGDREALIRYFYKLPIRTEYTPSPMERFLRNRYLFVFGFAGEPEREAFEKDLNHYLFLMMSGEEGEATKTLLHRLGEQFFCGTPNSDGTWYKYEEKEPRVIEGVWWLASVYKGPALAPDRGASALALIREQIRRTTTRYEEKMRKDEETRQTIIANGNWLGWMAETGAKIQQDEHREILGLHTLYARVAKRVDLIDKIEKLGRLLWQYPVWVRGGQPVTEYERPRALADVIVERQNQIVQLPQYEALCRVQDGREFVEKHIGIVNAYERWVVMADDPTARIKAASSRKYGRERAQVEQELAARVLAGKSERSIPPAWDE